MMSELKGDKWGEPKKIPGIGDFRGLSGCFNAKGKLSLVFSAAGETERRVRLLEEP